MLTVVSNPASAGEVVPTPDYRNDQFPNLYNLNDVVTLVAQPSAGYVFDRWTGNVDGVADVTQSTVSVVMTDSKSITANFATSLERYAVTVASDPIGGGSIVLSPNEESYAVNQIVSVSANSNHGYAFSHWAGDLTGTSSAASLRVDEDKSIAAIFNLTLSVQAVAVDGGTVEATPSSPSDGYPIGTVVRLTARPSLGYLFDGWTGDVSGILDVRKATVTVVMDTGRTLTANFVLSPPLKVTAVVEHEGSGSVTLEPRQPSEGYLANQEIKACAVAEVGYAFSYWTGDARGTSPTVALTVDSEKRIVVVFDPKVTVQCNPVEGGSVEVTSPRSSGGYATGTEIAVEAIASKGYKFRSWSDDLSGTDNPTSISVDSPKVLTALFVKESVFAWWLIPLMIVIVIIALIAFRLLWVLVIKRESYALE